MTPLNGEWNCPLAVAWCSWTPLYLGIGRPPLRLSRNNLRARKLQLLKTMTISESVNPLHSAPSQYLLPHRTPEPTPTKVKGKGKAKVLVPSSDGEMDEDGRLSEAGDIYREMNLPSPKKKVAVPVVL